MHKILSDREMRDVFLLVFANKQDIAGAIDPTELTTSLGLQDKPFNDLKWSVYPSNALEGDGLKDGLSWLSSALKDKNKGAKS